MANFIPDESRNFTKYVTIGNTTYTIRAVGVIHPSGEHIDLVSAFLKPFGIIAVKKRRSVTILQSRQIVKNQNDNLIELFKNERTNLKMEVSYIEFQVYFRVQGIREVKMAYEEFLIFKESVSFENKFEALVAFKKRFNEIVVKENFVANTDEYNLLE